MPADRLQTDVPQMEFHLLDQKGILHRHSRALVYLE